ncbi:MAG: hypothetical protein HGA45_37090, partial [Chloroflexales bacterium]|nr:hypothetical protein [Chloroflexales bacterium]
LHLDVLVFDTFLAQVREDLIDLRARHFLGFGRLLSHVKDRIMFRNLPRIILWLGILMFLVGMVGRYIINLRGASGTIPLVFSMPITILGFIALEPVYHRSALRGVTGLSLLGILLSLHVLPLLQALLRGEQPSHIASIIIRSTMLLLSSILLIVCVVAYLGTWWHQRRRA